MSYNRKDILSNSIKNNTLCMSCSRLKKYEWITNDIVVDDINKIYSKLCPICTNTICFSRKDYLKESVEKNTCCRSCSKKGKQPGWMVNGQVPTNILEKMSKTWFKKGQRPKNADMRKGKKLEEIYGINYAAEIRLKYSSWIRTSESNIRRRNTMIQQWKDGAFDNIDRTVSEETRQIHRLNMVKRLKATYKKFHPPYNKNACVYFDKLMVENNIHIQHALNGGEYHIKELGYWVDGYDTENNTVYEYDEKHHFKNGKLKNKDIIRQQQITDHLNCKFIRITE